MIGRKIEALVAELLPEVHEVPAAAPVVAVAVNAVPLIVPVRLMGFMVPMGALSPVPS